jgi:hypothetical protein
MRGTAAGVTPMIRLQRKLLSKSGSRTRLASARRSALELAGTDFIDENDGGPRVRLRKRPQAKPSKR